jgi:4-amino-4-deoxychorismate lyase
MLVNGKPGNLISVRDRGLLYGDGVFRTMRATQGKVREWPLHYNKLVNDCNALGIVCPDAAPLTSELNGLLKQHPVGVVRLIVTRGVGMRGYAPIGCIDPTHLWDVSPLPDYPDNWYVHGIKAQFCRSRLSRQPRLAGIKHLNRLENVLAAAESNDADIAEGLIMDEDDNVIEGTRSNLFLVLHGNLVTPDLTFSGVAGVQRDRVMQWATKHEMPVQVRNIGMDEMMNADELFVVNSIIGVWSIRELNQRYWTEFPFASKIRAYINGTDA